MSETNRSKMYFNTMGGEIENLLVRKNFKIEVVVLQFFYNANITGRKSRTIGCDIVFRNCLEKTKTDTETYFVENLIHASA